MRNYAKALTLSLLTLMFLGCSDEKTSKTAELEYLPVKLEGSERWSIMNFKTGEIVCKDDFTDSPSLVAHDVFFIKNGKGLYDYYNIENTNKSLNKESFCDVGDFVLSDITPATLPGKPITLINTKCEIVATLSDTIKECRTFVEGLACYKDINDKCGFIDEKGRIVIKAKYDGCVNFNDGIAVGWIHESYDLTTFFAIDRTGKELFKFTSGEYQSYGQYNDGFFPVYEDGDIFYLNKAGKKIYKLCTINYRERLSDFYYDLFICKDGFSVFCEDKLFGLKDKDNNIVIRAKYDFLNYLKDGEYQAVKNDKYGVIDANDNVKLDFKYDMVFKISKGVYLAFEGKIGTLINDRGQKNPVGIEDAVLARVASVKSDCVMANDEPEQLIDDYYESEVQ